VRAAGEEQTSKGWGEKEGKAKKWKGKTFHSGYLFNLYRNVILKRLSET
jgi:hypothetical protein